MIVKFEVCMPNQILPKIEKKKNTFNFKVNKKACNRGKVTLLFST